MFDISSEKKAMEEALTISVIGTDINEISEKTSESIIYGESGTGFYKRTAS